MIAVTVQSNAKCRYQRVTSSKQPKEVTDLAHESPSWVNNVLAEFDALPTSFAEFDVLGSLEKARKAREPLASSDVARWFPEWCAFTLNLVSNGKDSNWGTEFGPCATLTTDDGESTTLPALKEITPAVVTYWAERSIQTSNPVLAARYAHLVWVFQNKVCGFKPPIKIAQLAIESYLKAAIGAQSAELSDRWRTWTEQALFLAISTKNQIMTAAIKDEMLQRLAQLEGHTRDFDVWFVFDRLFQNKKANLSDQEKQSIISALNVAFQSAIHPSKPAAGDAEIDDHGALGSFERLITYYTEIEDDCSAKRLAEDLIEAMQRKSKAVSPLLGMSLLENLSEVLRSCGLSTARADVRKLYESLVPRSRAEMKTISTTSTIDRESVDKFVAQVLEGGFEDNVAQIGVAFFPSVEATKQRLEKIAKQSPLLSFLTTTLHVDNQVVTLGPLGDDPLGNLHNYMAQEIEFSSFALRVTLNNFYSRKNFSFDKLGAFLSESPLFDSDNMGLLLEGVRAHVSNDHVKALHVLIPQIESHLRFFLTQIEQPVSRLVHSKGLFMFDADSLGVMLSNNTLLEALGNDIVFYMMCLLSQKQGINLRNRIAHGLIHSSKISHVYSDRLIHLLFLLGSFRQRNPS